MTVGASYRASAPRLESVCRRRCIAGECPRLAVIAEGRSFVPTGAHTLLIAEYLRDLAGLCSGCPLGRLSRRV